MSPMSPSSGKSWRECSERGRHDLHEHGSHKPARERYRTGRCWTGRWEPKQPKGALLRRLTPLALPVAICAALLPANGGAAKSPAVLTASYARARNASTQNGSSAVTALQQAFVQVVSNVRPSVVQITDSTGLGSGIIYDQRGDIVTNDHVVGSSTSFTVQFLGGRQARATLVGAFPADDLAVIRVKGAPASVLKPARFANSDHLAVGDIVMAIGNPLAFSSSVTSGIISALDRYVPEPASGTTVGAVLANAIQTSAPINPGNSGGALVNLASEVVGIPTLAAEDPQIGGAAVGIGFAIPSDTVTEIANQIVLYGHVKNSHRADLGIYASQVYGSSGQPAGVGIDRFTNSASPAAKAGLVAGDVIVAIGTTHVTTLTELTTILAHYKPGGTVKLTYLRSNGTKATAIVTLGSLPGKA
jgi:putative serine protease PepD